MKDIEKLEEELEEFYIKGKTIKKDIPQEKITKMKQEEKEDSYRTCTYDLSRSYPFR